MNYEIYPINPKAHQFRVKLRLENSSKEGEIFYMPAWLPGSYLIRDFSKHIITIQAYEADNPANAVPFKKLDQIFFCTFFSQMIALYEAKKKKMKECHFVVAKNIRNVSNQMIY